MHRRPVYIYLFNVPSFSSRHFNKIKRTSRLGRLLALSLEILSIWRDNSNLIEPVTKYRGTEDRHFDPVNQFDKRIKVTSLSLSKKLAIFKEVNI